MERNSVIIFVLFACLLSLALAKPQQRRRYQQQQQQQQPSGYSYKPARLEQVAQPQRLYAAPPAASPVVSPVQSTADAKPARLVANSEAQEDIDDAAEEVEVPKAAVPAPVAPVAPVAPLQPPSIVYYPAGAVSFVQPTAYAKLLAAPQPAALASPTIPAAAAYVATPQYYAAYYG